MCMARIFPYRMRQPCDAEKHLSLCSLKICESVRKGEKPKKFFCQQCQNTRNFQCGFCYRKFFTGGEAEFHIANFHPIDTLANFKCEICELQDEFLAIPLLQRNKISNRGLPRWIKTQLSVKRLEKRMQAESIQAAKMDQEQEEVDFSDTKIYASEFPSLAKDHGWDEVEYGKSERYRAIVQASEKSYADAVQE